MFVRVERDIKRDRGDRQTEGREGEGVVRVREGVKMGGSKC